MSLNIFSLRLRSKFGLSYFQIFSLDDCKLSVGLAVSRMHNESDGRVLLEELIPKAVLQNILTDRTDRAAIAKTKVYNQQPKNYVQIN